MASFKPHLIVAIHAPYGVLDFDGPSVPPSKLGRLYLDQVGIFPGSLGNYGGVHKGIPVVTIELPNSLRTPLDADPVMKHTAFRRVLLTTIVNPKAMLVGTILIPAGTGMAATVWIATYAVLSMAAGLGWVILGSLLPLGIRRHAYKLASVILGGFSLVAIASVAHA